MRLGDLDALKEEIGSWGMNDYEPSDFIDAIDAAPTVNSRDKACEDCMYFDKPTTLEPCRNCTFAYISQFKAKAKEERPQGEFAEKLKDRIEESVCKYCRMNKHCELCEISRVFQIIDSTLAVEVKSTKDLERGKEE